MKIKKKLYMDFNDVLIQPNNISFLESRSNVDLNVEMSFPHSNLKWNGVPIFSANMDTICSQKVLDKFSENKMICAFHKYYDFQKLNVNDSNINSFCISTGINNNDLIKLKENIEYIQANGLVIKFICVDIANGYLNKLVDFCKKLRQLYPNKIIIAGNVVDKKMTKVLIKEGKVDIVKVGIGSGSACLTRTKTGIGVPQFSAVLKCAKAAHKLGGKIISDGGITCPGDIVKALGAGGDFVMIGGAFAGHEECNGTKLYDEISNKYFMRFYGMSSSEAMNKYNGK